MIPFRAIRKKIGDLLIERNIITKEQLDQALEEQKRKGGYLSQHLIALGFVSELDIASCLSNQFNFAYLPLKNYTISKEVLELIPLKWIRIYTLIPIDKIRSVVSVIMADPLNEGVIQMLQQVTNCDIEVFISTYSEINEAIDKYFGEKLRDLKEVYLDSKDLVKVKSATEFIQTKKYAGAERREYVRIDKELDASFYFHGRTFQAKTVNIGYGGVCFNSSIFIQLDTNLACKIYLKKGQPPIDGVINTLRINSRSKIDAEYPEELLGESYEVSGIFEFITAEDRESLVLFLNENIP